MATKKKKPADKALATRTPAKPKAKAVPKRPAAKRAGRSVASAGAGALSTRDVVSLVRETRGVPPALSSAIEKLASTSPSWERLGPQRITAPCHRPRAPFTVVVGDLRVSGNLVVATGKHDFGVLIVLGHVHARNVAVAAGWSLVCTGDLHAEEVIEACAGDSVTYVGGRVGALLLDSGAGAWLTMFGARTHLHATHLTGYVMSAKNQVWKPKAAVDVTDVVVDAALETEEWDSLDAADRVGERRADYVGVDTDAVLRLLGKGGGVLREARSGRAG